MYSTTMEIKTADSMQNIEITPVELHELIVSKTNIILLDVRTHKEVEIASFSGLHVPLNELSSKIGELDQESCLIIYCHYGVKNLVALNNIARSWI